MNIFMKIINFNLNNDLLVKRNSYKANPFLLRDVAIFHTIKNPQTIQNYRKLSMIINEACNKISLFITKPVYDQLSAPKTTKSLCNCSLPDSQAK